MANFGLISFALASCLALTSCSSTNENSFVSAFDYPEARIYVDCIVQQAKKRAFDNPQWFRNDDLDVPITAGYHACEAAELVFQIRAKADGMSLLKLTKFVVETRREAWDIAWDEIVRVRRERLEAMGAIR